MRGQVGTLARYVRNRGRPGGSSTARSTRSAGAFRSRGRGRARHAPLPPTKPGAFHKGCPVAFRDLRVLTVTYRGFDKHNHSGQLIVNKSAAAPLAKVFHRLYVIHFPIHHMSIATIYTKHGPADGDPTGS